MIPIPAAVTEFPRVRRSTRRWQRFITIAGLVLLSTLGMPVVRQCGHTYVPGLELYELAQHVATSGPASGGPGVIQLAKDLLLPFVWFAAPQLFGLCAALAAWRRPRYQSGRERSWADWLLCVYLIPIGVGALAYVAIEFGNIVTAIPSEPICLLGLTLSVTGAPYVCLALWRNRLTGVCATFIGAVCTLAYLSTVAYAHGFAWNGSDGALWGLYVMNAAALALLVGAVGEARAASGRPWYRALLSLCLAGVRAVRAPDECQQCGYLLIGLPQPRCPECGLPFDPATVTAVAAAV